MPVKQESAQTLINEVLQELSEINARKKQLEDLLKHLQKVAGGEPISSGEKLIRTPIPIKGKRKYKRRKSAHASRVAEILKKSGKVTMRVPEIVAGFGERCWKLPKYGSDVIRTTVKNNPDLFLYENGDVSLIAQN